MVKDAEKNAAEDKKRREEIDTRNRLDSMTYEVEKNAKEWSDKLARRAQGASSTASVERARKALRGDDMNEIRAAQEELNQDLQRGRPVVLRAEPGRAGRRRRRTGAGRRSRRRRRNSGGAKPADDVVEADYEIVDETRSK